MFWGNIPFGDQKLKLQLLAEKTNSSVSLLGNRRIAKAFVKAVRGYVSRNHVNGVLEHVRTVEKHFHVAQAA